MKQKSSIFELIKQFSELKIAQKNDQSFSEELLLALSQGSQWDFAIKRGDSKNLYKLVLANSSECRPISPESSISEMGNLKMQGSSEITLEEKNKKVVSYEFYALELFKAHQTSVEQIVFAKQKAFCENVLHNIVRFFEKFILNFPLKEEFLWQMITNIFPFYKQSHLILQCYLSSLIVLLMDFPDQMVRIVSLILNKFIHFDNNINEPIERLGNILNQQFNVFLIISSFL